MLPAPSAHRLPRSFYARETLTVARELLGMHLVHVRDGRRRVGRIVETEAYKGPHDLAAHSSRGRTRRTETMFGPPGHAYVYLIYGFWNCMNVVTAADGVPHAVLLRALEPIEGIEDTTHGPGLLCRAMQIDRGLNGADLLQGALWIEKPSGAHFRKPRIARSTRIGVGLRGRLGQEALEIFRPGLSVRLHCDGGGEKEGAGGEGWLEAWREGREQEVLKPADLRAEQAKSTDPPRLAPFRGPSVGALTSRRPSAGVKRRGDACEPPEPSSGAFVVSLRPHFQASFPPAVPPAPANASCS